MTDQQKLNQSARRLSDDTGIDIDTCQDMIAELLRQKDTKPNDLHGELAARIANSVLQIINPPYKRTEIAAIVEAQLKQAGVNRCRDCIFGFNTNL